MIATAVYVMLTAGLLWGDLRKDLLADPEHMRLFTDPLMGEAFAHSRPRLIRPGEGDRAVVFRTGSQIVWDGRAYRILNPGDSVISLVDSADPLVTLDLPRARLEAAVLEGHAVSSDPGTNETEVALARARAERVAAASPADLEDMVHKVRVVEAHLRGEAVSTPRSTLFRWLALYEESVALHGNGAYGLFRKPRSGNGTSRLGASIDALIDKIIATEFENVVAPSPEILVGLVHERLGALAPGEKAIRRRISERPTHAQAVARLGRKGAYPDEPYAPDVPDATPVDGDYDGHVAHIDSTVLDVVVISSRTGKPLGRPCVTVLRSARKRVRGYALRLDKPSTVAHLQTYDDAVRRNGRLDKVMVRDQGSEGHSTDDELFLAAHGSTVKDRPASKGRYGSSIEGLNMATDRLVIHNLPGNTKATKDVRAISPATKPEAHATLTMADLRRILDEFFFEIYDQRPQASLGGLSPREADERDRRFRGDRDVRRIDLSDPLYRALICPTVSGRTRKVHGVRGVQVGYLHYWHPVFADPKVRKTHRWVRQDPRDVRVVWVFAAGRWVQAICREFRHLRVISRDELLAASAEIAAQNKVFRAGRTNRAKVIAAFLERSLGGEAVLAARECADPLPSVNDGLVAVRTIPAEARGSQETDERAGATERAPDPQGNRTGGGTEWLRPLPAIDKPDYLADFLADTGPGEVA